MEINAGTDRTGASLLRLFGEATRSRQLMRAGHHHNHRHSHHNHHHGGVGSKRGGPGAESAAPLSSIPEEKGARGNKAKTGHKGGRLFSFMIMHHDQQDGLFLLHTHSSPSCHFPHVVGHHDDDMMGLGRLGVVCVYILKGAQRLQKVCYSVSCIRSAIILRSFWHVRMRRRQSKPHKTEACHQAKVSSHA